MQRDHVTGDCERWLAQPRRAAVVVVVVVIRCWATKIQAFQNEDVAENQNGREQGGDPWERDRTKRSGEIG